MNVSSTERPGRTAAALLDALVAQQQRVAAAQAELAALALVFADRRVADDEADSPLIRRFRAVLGRGSSWRMR